MYTINITKSSTKLTKSIISQMKHPCLDTLKTCKVLGYITNVKTLSAINKSTIMLLEGEEGIYSVIHMDYKYNNSDYVWRKDGKWTRQLKFSGTKCEEWWKAYNKLKGNATTQIYV